MQFDQPKAAAFDQEPEQEVIRIFKRLVDEGRRMLLVPHDIRLPVVVPDHPVFLHHGRKEEDSSPSTPIKNPPQERLRSFLSASA